mmetsp:Transcript_17265/g.40547  ORF Transcript_17265/g.40547 Transcript_17265/m.40547 type:complete len:93 (+) Transcript_17265:154-432(+)
MKSFLGHLRVLPTVVFKYRVFTPRSVLSLCPVRSDLRQDRIFLCSQGAREEVEASSLRLSRTLPSSVDSCHRPWQQRFGRCRLNIFVWSATM